MNKGLIAGLIIGGVLLFGGAGLYFTNSNSDDSSSTQVSADVITSILNPYDEPVTMTATVVDTADPSSNGTFVLQFEDEDTWAMDIQTVDGNSKIIFDNDFTYTQNPEDNSWIRLPSSADIESPADNFDLTDDDIDEFKTNAVSTGKSDCSLGTCETFDYTNPDTGEKSTMKVGSDGRFAEVKSTTDTSTITMVFDYDTAVKVEIPTDFVDFSVPQQ